jgi:hypothetical protein
LGLLWPAGRQFEAMRDLFGTAFAGEDVSGAWAELAAELEAYPGDALISNELLSGVQILKIRKLVAALPTEDTRVVVTARDLGRLVGSHWQMSVKNGNQLTWREYAAAICRDSPAPPTFPADESGAGGNSNGNGSEEGSALRGRNPLESDQFQPERLHRRFWFRQDLASLLRRWSRVIDPTRISLVTVPPRHQSGADTLESRFGEAIGVDLTTLDASGVESNTSLGAHSAELMRRLGSSVQVESWNDFRMSYAKALGRLVLSQRASSEPAYALTQDQQRWVRDRAQAMIDEVRSTGVRVIGDLAELIPAAEPPVDAVDPAEASAEELLAAASAGLVGMADLLTESIHTTQQLAGLLTEAGIEPPAIDLRGIRIEPLLPTEEGQSPA